MLQPAVTPRVRVRQDMSAYGDIIPGMQMMAAKYSGADLSLTSTGLATIQYGRVRRGLLSGDGVISRGSNKGKPVLGTPPDLRGVARLEWLEQRLDESMSDPVPELVAIEGYSFGSKTGREALGEWGGVGRLLFRRRGVSMVVFSPMQVKKFATGNHMAEKTEVSLALMKRWGIEEPQNDKADAIVLGIMAACIAVPGCLELTKFQQDALAKAEEI